MKKLIHVLSITFLLLQSCSSGDSNNSTNVDNVLLLRKWYDNSYVCGNGNRGYYEFSTPNIFRHYVTPSNTNCNYILPETGTWSKDGITIVIKYDQGIENSTLTIDKLSATTFSFVSSGGFGVGYHVLSSY